jgi:hypothetical protein
VVAVRDARAGRSTAPYSQSILYISHRIMDNSSSAGNVDPNTAAVDAAVTTLFQFGEWYERFKKHTIKSRVIPLSAAFIEYLNQDGVVLPVEAANNSRSVRNSEDDDSVDNSDDKGDDEDAPVPPSFPELSAQIREAIEALGGEVFIKLNWSCPSDAAWMLGAMDGSLKCRSLSDVYLLLKSSDRIQFDISHLQQQQQANNGTSSSAVVSAPYTLVLKQWRTINPSMEFRLFVRNNRLIGISQRDCYTYYPFLAAEMSSHLTEMLTEFYFDHLHKQFLSNSYAVDVFVTTSQNVKIVDFNPFGLPTDPLMFDWEYLQNAVSACLLDVTDESVEDGANPEVRIVKSDAEVMIDSRGAARGPIDVSLAPDFYQFMDICKQQAAENDV